MVQFSPGQSLVQLRLRSRLCSGQHCLAVLRPVAATERGHPRRANEWVNACYRVGPLLNSDYFASDLGKGQLSFKLTDLFPNPLWACAGPSPYPVSFLDFPGFHAFIQSDPLPRLDSLPLWLSTWLLLCMRLAKAFPCCFYFSLRILPKDR